ncbi:SanA/YdcF family protein [Cobetia marina]
MIVVGLNLWVVMSTRDRIASSPLTCESREVGIVFGTSHGLVGGGRNPHYQARLDTAAQLYRLHRVSNLLLSGDNRTRYYNEPMTMWRDLRDRNVPQQFMTLDYAGFSTFDTLVRAHKVFGVDQAVLVTQPWHLPRALFIADVLGLDAVGCPAVSERRPAGLRLMLREWLARAATVGIFTCGAASRVSWGRRSDCRHRYCQPYRPCQAVDDSGSAYRPANTKSPRLPIGSGGFSCLLEAFSAERARGQPARRRAAMPVW